MKKVENGQLPAFSSHKKHGEKNNSALPWDPSSSSGASAKRECMTALTAAVVCGWGFSQPVSNLFLLFAHSTSTGGSINSISGSQAVIIYYPPPFREAWELVLWRGRQRSGENVGPPLLQVLPHLLDSNKIPENQYRHCQEEETKRERVYGLQLSTVSPGSLAGCLPHLAFCGRSMPVLCSHPWRAQF